MMQVRRFPDDDGEGRTESGFAGLPSEGAAWDRGRDAPEEIAKTVKADEQETSGATERDPTGTLASTAAAPEQLGHPMNPASIAPGHILFDLYRVDELLGR